MLRTDILNARLRPGQKMKVEHLSGQYGIGATPVREALSRLTTLKLVQAEGQKGFRVAPVSVEELLDITRTRACIEAIGLRASISVGDAHWEANILAAAHRLMRIGTPNQAPLTDDWYLQNRAFHDALIAACQSKQIAAFREQLYDLSDRYRRLSVSGGLGGRDFGAEHQAIMDAVLARDADRAIARTADHFIATTEVILGAEIDDRRKLAETIDRLRQSIAVAIKVEHPAG